MPAEHHERLPGKAQLLATRFIGSAVPGCGNHNSEDACRDLEVTCFCRIGGRRLTRLKMSLQASRTRPVPAVVAWSQTGK